MTAAHAARGKRTEREFVRWAKLNGFEGCQRTRRMGWHVGDVMCEDEGDVGMAPGLIAQIRALRPANRMERAIPGWLAETEAQRAAAGADVALLVVRRDGTADVGEWFAWLPIDAVLGLAGANYGPSVIRLGVNPAWPLRLLVADAARLLRAAGYGSPLLAAAEVTG